MKRLLGLGSLALQKAAPSQKKCGRAPQAPDCAACGEEKRRRRKKEEEEFLSASSDSWLLVMLLPRVMDQWIGVRFLNPERCMNVFSRALLNDSHAILVGSYFRRCTCSPLFRSFFHPPKVHNRKPATYYTRNNKKKRSIEKLRRAAPYFFSAVNSFWRRAGVTWQQLLLHKGKSGCSFEES